MPPDDSALLAEIESLYRERFADFVAVAASIVGERESARDAVQDAFASVVRTRRDFRREAPLEAWVWRAVVNASRKKRGRYAREAQMHPTAPSANGSAPHDERAELAALIAALPNASASCSSCVITRISTTGALRKSCASKLEPSPQRCMPPTRVFAELSKRCRDERGPRP